MDFRENLARTSPLVEDAEGTSTAGGDSRWVNLIHETLIRSKGLDAEGKPQPYWPTLWNYIEQHQERAAWRERLQTDTRIWNENQRRPSDLWSHERVREVITVLGRAGPDLRLSCDELAFLGPIDPDAMLVELEKLETTHQHRRLIGERLDVLGDPRRGVGIDSQGIPKISWCAVPAGEVAIEVERVLIPGKWVNSFHIARYPVTVAQYRAFLKADDGWRNPQWWGSDLYRDPEGDTYDIARAGTNYPVVHVNWFDAMAFCRWLSQRVGFEVRLPDEREWQQAATGGDSTRKYPWGLDWDPKSDPYRANTFESQLGGVTAVGMYPAGASAQGALDMAGTVWEWCLNKFDQPDITESSNDDFGTRVLRGGSWVNLLWSCNTAYRRSHHPDRRFVDLCFRLCCASPIE